MFNKKEKKLLLECIDHVLEWELHMNRATTTRLVEGILGENIPETKMTKKYSELIELKKQINKRKL